MTASKPLDLAQFEGHTPGPWKALPHKDALYGPNRWNRCNVYTLADSPPLAESVYKPDARLIAAAPALLAECKRQRESIAYLETSLRRRDDDVKAEMAKVDALHSQVQALREALDECCTVTGAIGLRDAGPMAKRRFVAINETARAALKVSE